MEQVGRRGRHPRRQRTGRGRGARHRGAGGGVDLEALGLGRAEPAPAWTRTTSGTTSPTPWSPSSSSAARSTSSTTCWPTGPTTTSRCPPDCPPTSPPSSSATASCPAWTDQAKLDRAFDFYERRGTYLGVLYGLGSGMMSCVIPREARAVYYSAGGADMKDRIAKTAKLGYDIGSARAFEPGGQMIVTCLKTRLTHSAVRYLLPRVEPLEGRRRGDQADQPGRHHGDLAQPGHLQHEQAGRLEGADARRRRRRRSCTCGRSPRTSWASRTSTSPPPGPQANLQSRQVLDPILAPTPEGIKLADILLNLAAEYDRGLSKPLLNAFTRYMPRRPDRRLAARSRARRWTRSSPTAGRRSSRSRRRLVNLPLVPKLYWIFDEFLRLGVLFFLNEGRRIDITMPTGNNPNYS